MKVHGKLWNFRVHFRKHHGHVGIRWRWMKLHGKRVRYYLGAGGKFGFLLWGRRKLRFHIGAGGRVNLKVGGKLWRFHVHFGHGGHTGIRWRWRRFHGKGVRYYITGGGRFGYMMWAGRKVRFNIAAGGHASMRWKGKVWKFGVNLGKWGFHLGGHAHGHGHAGIRWRWR